MRNAVILVVLAGAAGPALAESTPSAIDGEVVQIRSRWTPSRDRIVSETTVRADDGREVVMLQLGGTVDGIGMRVTHMPGVPNVGERVHATYTSAVTGGGATVNRVEEMTAVVAQSSPGRQVDPGYVNTRTRESGTELYWSSGCVYVGYDAEGTSHLDNEFAVIDQVFATWRAAIADCSYLRFELEGKIEGEETRYDGLNLIKFRDARWCRPADGETPEMCYAPAAAALTTLFFVDDPDSSRDGEIVDADIEMNSVNFAISDQGGTNGSPDCLADLSNTLTHEVGHLMGLDHTCWTGQLPRPIDDEGAQVPSCSPEVSLPAEIKDATMYNFQVCGETKKSSPEQDDIDAICMLYPIADAPSSCKRVDIGGTGGCCSVAPGRRGAPKGEWLGGLLLAALALLATAYARNRGCRAANSTAPSRSRLP